jgi:hypothetical protein
MKKKSIIYKDYNILSFSLILRKLITFTKVVLTFSKKDFYSTVNFFRFRLRIRRKIIKKFEDIHKGETIFLIGAGPSLNNENLKILDEKIIIAYNFSFQALEKTKPKKIYSCISGARINPGKDVDRSLFNASFRYPGAKEDEIILSDAIRKTDIILPVPYKFFLYKIKDGDTGFSFDISKEFRFNGGSTGLLSCVQLAVYMGAKRIVLLGADFDCKDKNLTHHQKADFIKTTHWDDNLINWYELKKPEIFSSLKKLQKILKENKIDFVNASSYTSEEILTKKKLDDFI